MTTETAQAYWLIENKVDPMTRIIPLQQVKTILSEREMEILHLIAHEHSSKEIASRLYISTHTVLSHRKNMMMKLGVKNTAGLVRVGFERGWLGRCKL